MRKADLTRCLHTLDAGTLRPALIVLVDSGSDSAAYLEGFAAQPDIHCLKAGNIGYYLFSNVNYFALTGY